MQTYLDNSDSYHTQCPQKTSSAKVYLLRSQCLDWYLLLLLFHDKGDREADGSLDGKKDTAVKLRKIKTGIFTYRMKYNISNTLAITHAHSYCYQKGLTTSK